ncbi:REP element-mobilizing transposase RayT [Geoalkalibacter ferrihydriticus]|nr:transposase [Geoalkalibacter ferrihydriticus]SDM83287.1 REP element-mobilizing transposase RayT [Geoalkalibacter ferrihydriticus]
MYNPDVHNRRSIRLRDFNYDDGGAYFVTACAWRRECLFGDVVDGLVRLNELGMVVRDCWTAIPQHFPHVELDEFIIMPNHIHGVFWIVNDNSPVGATHASPDLGSINPAETGALTRATHASPLRRPGPKRRSVGAIVGSFKSAATKRINAMRDDVGCPVWQRNYYEHVIRDERDLHAVRQYIADNPAKWELDTNHPARI